MMDVRLAQIIGHKDASRFKELCAQDDAFLAHARSELERMNAVPDGQCYSTRTSKKYLQQLFDDLGNVQ